MRVIPSRHTCEGRQGYQFPTEKSQFIFYIYIIYSAIYIFFVFFFYLSPFVKWSFHFDSLVALLLFLFLSFFRLVVDGCLNICPKISLAGAKNWLTPSSLAILKLVCLLIINYWDIAGVELFRVTLFYFCHIVFIYSFFFLCLISFIYYFTLRCSFDFMCTSFDNEYFSKCLLFFCGIYFFFFRWLQKLSSWPIKSVDKIMNNIIDNAPDTSFKWALFPVFLQNWTNRLC